MARTEGVIFAFRAAGEARQAAPLADRAHALAPTRQDLVRIGLMAHVPDERIARRLKDMMKGDGQFHNAKAGPQMAARRRNAFDHVMAKLAGQSFELVDGEIAQIGG